MSPRLDLRMCLTLLTRFWDVVAAADGEDVEISPMTFDDAADADHSPKYK